MNYDFPNIEVADIEKKINLKQKAETDGRNNIPPTNSIVRSITEEEAITEYDNIRHKAVDKAVEFKLGARGLRGILESLLTQAMFELPGSDVKEFVVDRKYCEEQENNPSNPGLKVA